MAEVLAAVATGLYRSGVPWHPAKEAVAAARRSVDAAVDWSTALRPVAGVVALLTDALPAGVGVGAVTADDTAAPPMHLRSRAWSGSACVTSSPSRWMRPEVGSMRRLTISSVVVFPQPEGPTKITISPSGMSSVSSGTAGTAGSCTPRARSSTRTPVPATSRAATSTVTTS